MNAFASKSEFERRHGNTEKVIALFKARPLQWIPWQELAEIGGSCSWRTRVSEARRRVKKDGHDIVWNRQRASAYMFTPFQALGRDAGTPTERLLFDVSPRA